MEQYITYALKVIICSGLFYALYKLWLEGRTDYGFCRFYLIGSALLSAAIPLLKIRAFAGQIIEVPVIPFGYYSSYDISTVLEVTGPRESWPGLLLFGYFAVVLFLLAGIISQLISVSRYTKNASKTVMDGLRIYEGDQIKTPFTFFRKVFLPAGLPANERRQILTHEASHALHNHGPEILIMELLKAILWFNPFIWLSRMSLEQVHEYQADSDVIETGCDINNYKSLLFRQLVGYSPDISSGLACSKTKKRLIMMNKTKPGRSSILRASAALPLVCGMLLLFSFTTKEPVYVYAGISGESAEIDLNEIATVKANQPQMYYFVDGKEVAKEFVEAMDPEAIASVNMVANEEILEEYGKSATSLGLILINTKNGDTGNTDAINFVIGTQTVTDETGSHRISIETDDSNLFRLAASGQAVPTIILNGKEVDLDLIGNLTADIIENITVLKDQAALEVYGDKGKNGVIVLNTKEYEVEVKNSAAIDDDEPLIKVDISPKFQGGDLMTFRHWVNSNLAYPVQAVKDKIQGKVVARFVVRKDGSVDSVEILSSPDKLLSDEVERVIKLSPKWEPGKQGGNAVSVMFNIPVDFQLSNGDDE